MNIIFFGSSKYSTIVETTLIKNFGLSLVLTVADKIVGRKKELMPSPVKKIAEENNIQVIAEDKLTKDIVEKIKTFKPDFLVVADYGLILPKELLEIPTKAPINVHHSLLPKYRGPSPAPSAILAGEKTSGVSIIVMNDKVDSGDLLGQIEYELKKDETTDSLLTKLNTLGAELLVKILNDFDKFYKERKEQVESKVTFTAYMEKSHGFVDINNLPSSEKLDRMIRAYYPWPGVWTKLRLNGSEKIVKLLPNAIIQVEGKNPMTKIDFLNGYPSLKLQLEKLLGN